MEKTSDILQILDKVKDLAQQGNQAGNPSPPDSLKMPQMALVMANYFNSLSKYCLSIYYGHTRADPTTQKKKRKGREQLAMKPPKKPLSAYIRFYGEKYSDYQKKYPSYSISQLTKVIAQDWTNLPQKDKEPYVAQSTQDRIHYEEELQKFASFNADHPEKPNKKTQPLPKSEDGPEDEQQSYVSEESQVSEDEIE